MKTKTMKRLAAAVAAITMMSAVPIIGVPVTEISAASITIEATSDSVNHEYVAYQIFSGEATSTANELTNIGWGDAITENSNEILSLLNATSIADAVSKINTTTDTRLLASQIYKKVKANTSHTFNGNTLNNIDDGYYLIVDTTAVSNNDTANSFNMLKVVGTATISPKIEHPTLKKELRTSKDGEAEAWGAENTASIGDTIYYKLESAVPDMTGYSEYFFVIEDNLTNGLVLNYDEKSSSRGSSTNKFVVEIATDSGTKTLTDITNIDGTDQTPYTARTGENYYVIPGNDGKSFKLVFVNFKQYNNLKDKTITIKYNATLSNTNVSYATDAASANNNTADLIYSNNPNYDYKGIPAGSPDDSSTPNDESKQRPDEPYPGKPDDPSTPNTDESEPADSTSETTPETVHTYTAKLKINKVDGQNIALNGADFAVYTGYNSETKELSGKLENIIKTGSSSGNEFIFSGLGEGTYYINEETVPTGFNGLAEPLKLVVSATENNGCTWSVGDDSTKSNSTPVFSLDTADKSLYKATVVNQAGATLPSTGGIGTTIFYVSGGVLILGAGVVLITKKRMSLKDDK